MSKKKAFGGNTMTLKDFHGGSIPSDLPLPSAPGVVVRPMDRSGFDRPASWGNPMGRPDHRPRPSSSPATRHFDDKSPFLTHAAHIGRNFDEDERKPLDGGFAPRRTVSDDSFRVPPSRVEFKPDPVSTGRVTGWGGAGSVSRVSSGAVNSHSGRVVEQSHVGMNVPNSGGSSGQFSSGSYPNAWTARKEVAVGVTEPFQSEWSGQSTATKLAHASALEKVSSGRWQSKHSIQYQADDQVVKFSETDGGLHPKVYDDNVYNKSNVVGGRESSDANLVRHMERGYNIENRVQGGRKEELDYEKTVASTYLEVKERTPTCLVDRVQPTRSNGKSGGSESQPPVYSSTLDRPKFNLHSRTKQVESLEMNIANPKQRYHQISESAHGHFETIGGMHRNVNPTKSDLAGTDDGNHAVERPKLNLKPRSQPPEQLEVNSERGRTSLFGGARPRELVLKERGIDDVAINNHTINDHDVGQNSDRNKHNIPKTERAPAPAILTRQSGRTENLPLDQRTVRKFERKDNRVDIERVDAQRGNWRNENRRNIRGTEKEQQQQQERQPSPETWRKPLEQAKPAAADAASARHGKVASAVELAKAFSRSFSDPKSDVRHSGQRGPSSRIQVPFSRLMGPTTRPQINGY
ncbi:hypothetical protein Dsin_032631 [Dipteronia sinensis]|uniref:Uncharacterized protein n=1 Tax=Dipteronia sinensis TaxID=43782 RepID=A0AAE0DQK8_9ROSI|nr:hypothetical protein Dsin_032631 [Dipteronia sinensis]